MIKAVAYGDKGTLLLLGLSQENMRELKKDRPIVVDPTELGVDVKPILITVIHEDGSAFKPLKYNATKDFSAIIALPDDIPDGLETIIAAEAKDFDICLWLGQDDAQMHQLIKEQISEETKVKRSGYAPTEQHPPSDN